MQNVNEESMILPLYLPVAERVAILIDEYDKPVVDNLTRPELREKFRETL